MDAAIKLILSGFTWVGVNKDFIVLCGIFIASVMQYVNFKVQRAELKTQKAECDGKFNLQNYKILDVEAKVKESRDNSKEALDIASQAHSCVTKINDRVKSMHEGYEQFIVGKYGDAKKETK
jgi:hypothetical protein